MPLGYLSLGRCFEHVQPEKRPRGRPKTHWTDYISCLVWECPGVLTEEWVEVAGENLGFLEPKPAQNSKIFAEPKVILIILLTLH